MRECMKLFLDAQVQITRIYVVSLIILLIWLLILNRILQFFAMI